MKVLLIFPPQFKAITPRFKTRLQEGLGFLPPYGLLSIASRLKAQELAEVEIIDSLAEKLTYPQLGEKIKQADADLVGVSAMTHTLVDALETIRMAKELRPQTPVVLGGPHTQLYPQESVKYAGVDYVVLGEGEIPFTDLIRQLIQGKNAEPVPGVISRDNINIKLAEPFWAQDLNRLELVDYSLLDPEKYFTVVSQHPPTTMIISSRGCPHRCIFCHTAGGKTWRGLNSEKIIANLKAAKLLGIKEFFFFDENFLHSRDRAVKFAESLITENLGIFFDFRTRADSVDLELLKLLKKAGAQRVQFGLESGSSAILKALKKGFTVEQASSAVKTAHKAGLTTYASFMLGLPGEKLEHIQETLNFALSLPLDLVDCSIAMPLPGTEMYKMAQEKGLIKGDPWKEFALNPNHEFVIPYWEENFSREELEQLLSNFFRRFYFRVSYLLKSLRNIKSFGELNRKLRAAGKVLFRI